ncbi:hydroxyethylthiazole kinase [Streptomyces sp. NPDC005227]|uniref:hydroxyethylthiazole kinase n=1 Tax=unclassified Streptomyces TaxID=2593676 RepID=UPI00367E1572
MLAVSGPLDFATDGCDSRIANGTTLIKQVAGGGGGALAAMMTAFAAVEGDRLATTVAAVTVDKVAAEMAEQQASRPGSFAVAFLDTLAAVTEQDFVERAALS